MSPIGERVFLWIWRLCASAIALVALLVGVVGLIDLTPLALMLPLGAMLLALVMFSE